MGFVKKALVFILFGVPALAYAQPLPEAYASFSSFFPGDSDSIARDLVFGEALTSNLGSALAVNSPIPTVSLTVNLTHEDGFSFTHGVAYLVYYYNVIGPNVNTVVPVNIFGRGSTGPIPTPNSGTTTQIFADIDVNSFASAGNPKRDNDHPNTLMFSFGCEENGPTRSSESPRRSCNNVGFSGHGEVLSGTGNDYEVFLYVDTEIQNVDVVGAEVSRSAYIDPYIVIDPTWAAENPGYSVVVSQGFGNSPVLLPVPEPQTEALMLAGLAVLGAVASRRKSIHS